MAVHILEAVALNIWGWCSQARAEMLSMLVKVRPHPDTGAAALVKCSGVA